jgi:hypothetical protein
MIKSILIVVLGSYSLWLSHLCKVTTEELSDHKMQFMPIQASCPSFSKRDFTLPRRSDNGKHIVFKM